MWGSELRLISIPLARVTRAGSRLDSPDRCSGYFSAERGAKEEEGKKREAQKERRDNRLQEASLGKG